MADVESSEKELKRGVRGLRFLPLASASPPSGTTLWKFQYKSMVTPFTSLRELRSLNSSSDWGNNRVIWRLSVIKSWYREVSTSSVSFWQMIKSKS